jgi:hypothetical protein
MIPEEIPVRSFRSLLAPLFALVSAAAFAGCPAPAGDDDGGNCTTDYSCENGVCSCADGSSCTDPEETSADDAYNCDNACEVCE